MKLAGLITHEHVFVKGRRGSRFAISSIPGCVAASSYRPDQGALPRSVQRLAALGELESHVGEIRCASLKITDIACRRCWRPMPPGFKGPGIPRRPQLRRRRNRNAPCKGPLPRQPPESMAATNLRRCVPLSVARQSPDDLYGVSRGGTCAQVPDRPVEVTGGERGIRTLEGLLTLTPLAGVRLRPLGHLSALAENLNISIT